jgi:hypothetical protein
MLQPTDGPRYARGFLLRPPALVFHERLHKKAPCSKRTCVVVPLHHPTTYISVNYLHGSRDFVDKATRASQVPREFANPSLPPLPPFACRLKGFGMLVGCSCFVGPAGNAAWAIHSECLMSWISSCPRVLTSSAELLMTMMLPCHITSQPQSPPSPLSFRR